MESAVTSPSRSEVAVLADGLHALLMAASPFEATMLAVPGYDADVPDLSHEAEQQHFRSLDGLRDRAGALDESHLAPADRVTLATVRNALDAAQALLANRGVEHTLASIGADGPSMLFGVSARATPATAAQAEDVLTRTSRYPGYLAQHLQRLQQGGAAGRYPVESVAAVAVAQVTAYLEDSGSDVLADVSPPADWEGAEAWSERLASVVRGQVRPALVAWRDGAVALRTRSDDACGLVHLPGGAADYDRLVAVHTTLPLTATEVHQRGIAMVADLQEQMVVAGAGIGLDGLTAVLDAVRSSGDAVDPEEAMEASREVIRRAEAAVPGVFPAPPAPPCAVTAMSVHLARAGTPPHYTPARPDEGVAGTYWFNTEQASPGSGWGLESTAFHEAVPGHHTQFSRSLAVTGVPALQMKGVVTAHAEGWGLYAEVLADELGLYSSTQARLGALSSRLFRAARLVVDTGMHAMGWTRDEAVAWLTQNTAMAPAFIASEVNRYIAMPGQALSYATGLVEVLRLRERAQQALGERFTLAGFHAAVLDSGSLPLPALADAVDVWVASQG